MHQQHVLAVPAELLPELHMLPEEEPEQQLQDVSKAQLAEHQAAQKAAADKAAGASAGGLGGFAGAKAGPQNKHATAETSKRTAAGGAIAPVKQGSGASSADAAQRGASEAGAAPCTLSHAQLRKLHVERQQLLGKCGHPQNTVLVGVAALPSSRPPTCCLQGNEHSLFAFRSITHVICQQLRTGVAAATVSKH
jgi:hypothetical protein